MKMVNLVQKLGLTLGLLVMINHAVAATYDLSGTGGYQDFSDLTYSYYSSGVLESAGFFNDTFIFTAPEGEMWSFYAYAENWDGMIDEFTEILFQGSTGEVGDMYAEIGLPPSLWYLPPPLLSDSEVIIGPGVYSVSVSGMASMPYSNYAEYGMTIHLSAVSPIPEPKTIALLLGGLGLVGFMVLRHRKRK